MRKYVRSIKHLAEIYRKLLFFLLLLFITCCNCSKKELTIIPISGSQRHDEHVFHIGNDEFQYYTIANYQHFTPDSLYKELNAYISSRYSYNKIVETREDNSFFCAFFYKKALSVNYKKHLYDAIRSEFGSIYGYKDNLIAKIYYYKEKNEQYPIFTTVIYNKDKILVVKEDTINEYK